MRFRRVLVAMPVVLHLIGCSAIQHPELIDEHTLPLEALTSAIKCELHRAVAAKLEHNKWLRDWQGQYVITFKANQIAYAKLSTSTFPVVLPRSSLLNVGFGAGYTSTANRTAILKYNISFKDIGHRPDCEMPLRPDGHPFLTGEIGFRQWIDRAIKGSDDQNEKTNAQKLTSIGHTFEFMVDVNGALSPSFVIGPSPSVLVNPTGSLERVEDNIVDVSFGKIPSQGLSTTDIQKILSANNKQLIKDLQDASKNEDRKVASAKLELANPAFATAVRLEQKREDLTNQMMFVESKMGGLAKTQNLDRLSKELQETDRAIADIPQHTKVVQLRARIHDAQARIDANKAEIERTKQSRDDIRITQRITQVPAVALSPENNSNVTNTLLQLQLERLVTSRLPGT